MSGLILGSMYELMNCTALVVATYWREIAAGVVFAVFYGTTKRVAVKQTPRIAGLLSRIVLPDN